MADKKITELSSVSTLPDGAVFTAVDSTRSAGDQNVKISKADLEADIGGGANLEKDVNQTAHGFSEGNVVRLDGANYVLAQADAVANANAISFVTEVVDADNFKIQSESYISVSLGLSNGDEAFLSTTVAGGIQTTEPANGEVNVYLGQQTPQGFLISISTGFVVGSTGGGGLPIAQKTGSTMVFTEDAFYNESTPLTSGDITIDGTSAVVGATVQMHCDRYVPNILTAGSEEWRLMDNGIALADFINVYQIMYDGNIYKVWITKIARLNTPILTITSQSNTNIVSGWDVPNATNYVIKFNTVDDESTATQIYTGDGTDLTPDFEFEHTGLTNGTLYYYYITAEGEGIEDSPIGTGQGTPRPGFTAFFASPTNTVDFSQILKSTGSYNFQFIIDDVPGDTITTWNQAETLLDLGDTAQHKVELRGTVVGFQIGNTTEDQKIYDITDWGTMQWGIGDASISRFFQDCDNLSISATDIPDLNTTTLANCFTQISNSFSFDMSGWDLSQVTSVSGMFGDSTGINPNIEGIDWSNVSIFTNFLLNTDAWTGTMTNANLASATNCQQMFRNNSGANADVDTWTNFAPTIISNMLQASGFTSKDLSNWDITNLTAANNFMLGETLSTIDYDSTLISWSAQSPLPTGIAFHFGNSQYTLGGAAETARDAIIAAGNTITDGGGV